MKKTCAVFLVLLMVSLLFCSYSGFKTEPFDEETEERLLQAYTFTVSTEPPPNYGIKSFAVSENGTVSVLGIMFSEAAIVIYDSQGDYQRTYYFDVSGSYGVDWDGETLLVCSVRGDTVCWVSEDGTTTAVKDIQQCKENDVYWREKIFARKYETDDAVYTMKNDMGLLNWVAFSYAKLEMQKADGTVQAIHDVHDAALVRTATGLVFFLCVWIFGITIVVIRVYRYILQYDKKTTPKPKT